MGNEQSQHIEHAHKTGILQLKNFKLQKVPDELLPVAKKLRTLDLSTNRLKEIPAQLFKELVLLKTLNLNNNKLDVLPNEFGLLFKLENLNLNSNQLTRLPSSINKLHNLKKLEITNNLLKDIPYDLCALKQLDHIDLSNNQIENIKDQISDISCIEINLNSNKIRSISPNISICPRLKVLRLDNNFIEINAIPLSLLKDSNISLLSFEGNLFTLKSFQQMEGYDSYIERYTATRRKFD